MAKLWANLGHFYVPRAFSCKKQSILMLKRPRRNHRAPTIMVLTNFRKFQFSAPIFGRDATPAPGGLELLKPPKKLTHRVVLTTQLLTRNQNFLNTSADTPSPLNKNGSPITSQAPDLTLTIIKYPNFCFREKSSPFHELVQKQSIMWTVRELVSQSMIF